MQARTAGRVAPLRLTTMRAVAHITLSGDFPRMPQHASVISGTSAAASISGKTISRTGSSASIATLQLGEQLGETGADLRLRFTRQPAARDMQSEAVSREPQEAVDRRLPTAPAAFRFVDAATVMVD